MGITRSAFGTEELVERAAGLVPRLRDQALECERNREVSVEMIEAIKDAELFRALQPARYGGFELDLTSLLRLGAEIGSGCGSTGWVFGVLSDHQWLLGLFPLELQDEIWGDDPATLVSAGYAPASTAEPVEGGYRLSGRWGFGSGSAHASWHLFGAKIPREDGAPEAGLFAVPRADYRIDDNWETVGLSGTGSNDVILEDAFIPTHRMSTFASLSKGGSRAHDAPVYRLPFATGVALGTLSPVIGMARGAIDSFIETTKTRVSSGGATRGASKAAESAVVQTRLAEAMGLQDAARVLLMRDLETSYEIVAGGQELPIEERVRNRRDYALAVDFCVKAMAALFASGGAGGIQLSNPVQRFWRDVNVAARHVGLNWDVNSTPYGQFQLGLEPKGQY